jgi:hypothetical protein
VVPEARADLIAVARRVREQFLDGRDNDGQQRCFHGSSAGPTACTWRGRWHALFLLLLLSARKVANRQLDYHLYTAPLPHITNPSLSSHPLHSFFIPDDLRRTLTSRHEATYATPSGPTGLPNELGVYHNLVPLGAPPGQGPGQGSRVWGHPAPIYKATSSVDGNVYALRRIEGESRL